MVAMERIGYLFGGFAALMAVIYGLWNDFSEPVGVTGLVLGALLGFMIAGYLNITERRMDIVPEDWEEAEIEDGAGVLGFFSPGSIWPFAMSMSIGVLGLGIAFWQLWLLAIGAVLLIGTTAMLNLQYGIPREKH